MKMLKTILITTTVMLFMLTQVNAQDNPLLWRVFNASETGKAQEGEKYGLWCIPEKDFPIAEWRKLGVNIKWKSTNPLNITFKKQNGTGQIVTGEKIAIHFAGEKGGYLYYKRREHGINLEFSPTPVYEWEFRNGSNKDGDNVLIEERVAIFSTVENDFLVGCQWPLKDVVNLAWCQDCWGGKRIQGLPAPMRKKIKDWALKLAPLVL